MEKRELLKKYEKQFKLWRGLKIYVLKRMKGKTPTKDIEKNVNDMIKERKRYFDKVKGGSKK